MLAYFSESGTMGRGGKGPIIMSDTNVRLSEQPDRILVKCVWEQCPLMRICQRQNFANVMANTITNIGKTKKMKSDMKEVNGLLKGDL